MSPVFADWKVQDFQFIAYDNVIDRIFVQQYWAAGMK